MASPQQPPEVPGSAISCKYKSGFLEQLETLFISGNILVPDGTWSEFYTRAQTVYYAQLLYLGFMFATNLAFLGWRVVRARRAARLAGQETGTPPRILRVQPRGARGRT